MNHNRQKAPRMRLNSFVSPDRMCYPRRTTKTQTPVLVAALLVISLLPSASATAQNGSTSEQKIKVAYLYNFIRYVEWPDQAFQDSSSPFVIGVMANDPHGRLLDRVAAKKRARGRRIIVRRFRSSDEIRNCHLVFISAVSNAADEAEAIARTKNQHTLLVCDAVVAPQPGSPIRFFADHDGTIGLRINVDAMGRRALKADAKLLNIATVERG